MKPNSTRVIVTEKGRHLQDEFVRETGTDFLGLKTSRAFFQEKESYHVIPESGLYSCRSGYFRSKQPTHIILKTEASGRLYPNYLKRDPREYPSKHECIWTPKSTVSTSRHVPTEYPVTRELHHTIMKSHPDEIPDKLTAKDSNSIVGGREPSFGAINLTTCNYPAYRTQIPNKNLDVLKNVTRLGSAASMNNSNAWDIGRRALSEVSMLQSGPYTPKGSTNFKLAFDKLPNQSKIDPEVSSNRILTSPSQIMQTTFTGGQNTSGWVTQRYLIKGTKEKVEQVYRRVQEKEDEYNKLLDRLDRTTKDKLYKQLENPDYLPKFESDMKKGAELIKKLHGDDQKEMARFRMRLKELGDSKYGKSWKRWDKSIVPKATTEKPKMNTTRTASVASFDGKSVASLASAAPIYIQGDEVNQMASPSSRQQQVLLTKTSLHI